jgi:hypothetical protein
MEAAGWRVGMETLAGEREVFFIGLGGGEPVAEGLGQADGAYCSASAMICSTGMA